MIFEKRKIIECPYTENICKTECPYCPAIYKMRKVPLSKRRHKAEFSNLMEIALIALIDKLNELPKPKVPSEPKDKVENDVKGLETGKA